VQMRVCSGEPRELDDDDGGGAAAVPGEDGGNLSVTRRERASEPARGTHVRASR
jgi:hypothetical protein